MDQHELASAMRKKSSLNLCLELAKKKTSGLY